MVTIIDFKSYENSNTGENFNSLVIQGGIEMVKSKETGRFYATARKTTIPSTFDEATCKALIGQTMPGNVKKVETEPYDYTVESTGEVIQLSHRYEYVEEKAVSQTSVVEGVIY